MSPNITAAIATGNVASGRTSPVPWHAIACGIKKDWGIVRVERRRITVVDGWHAIACEIKKDWGMLRVERCRTTVVVPWHAIACGIKKDWGMLQVERRRITVVAGLDPGQTGVNFYWL